MKNTMFLLVATLFAGIATTPITQAEQAKPASAKQHKSYRAVKKVPAMRNRVYTQLARAQQLADEGDKIEGFAVLDDVKDRISSLNSYERAMLFNFYGFMYYANDDVDMALTSFSEVITDESAIPDSLVTSTLYSLAQLSMQQQNFTQALSYLTRWKKVNPNKLTANQVILFAQVYYQDKQFEQSLAMINQAITIAEQDNKIAKENWLTLQRAAYYELEQPEQVTKVIEQLVHHYPKAQYWLQLSAMYGEIGQEDKQMAVMEAAYQAGHVTKSADILTLAQLYLYHGAPYKSADVLEHSMTEGALVADEKNLAILARAYLKAKETAKAIVVLKKVSELSNSARHTVLLAQTYLNDEQWQSAITTAGDALARMGDVSESEVKVAKDIANMHLVLGMANFNLKQFEPSLAAFSKASRFASTKKAALQWGKYVEREQQHHKIQLAMLN